MIGYTGFDHAAWVENQIAAARGNEERAQAARAAVAAAKGRTLREKKWPEKGWLAAPYPLPPFQRRAMHVLGMTFGGIYNAAIAWDAVDWGGGHHLHVPVSGHMATVDHNTLTAFVFLCHEAGIRGQIAPNGARYLRLSMWQRERGSGRPEGCPTGWGAMAAIASALGSNHPVSLEYRPPERVCGVCGINLDSDEACARAAHETCPGGHQ